MLLSWYQTRIAESQLSSILACGLVVYITTPTVNGAKLTKYMYIVEAAGPGRHAHAAVSWIVSVPFVECGCVIWPGQLADAPDEWSDRLSRVFSKLQACLRRIWVQMIVERDSE
jgi:hypothetical protein